MQKVADFVMCPSILHHMLAVVRDHDRHLLAAAQQVTSTSLKEGLPVVERRGSCVAECERLLIAIGLTVRAVSSSLANADTQLWCDIVFAYCGAIARFTVIAEGDAELSKLLQTSLSVDLIVDLTRQAMAASEAGTTADPRLSSPFQIVRVLLQTAANCAACKCRSLKTALAEVIPNVITFLDRVPTPAALEGTDSVAPLWIQLFRFVGNASFGSHGAVAAGQPRSDSGSAAALPPLEGAMLFKTRFVDAMTQVGEKASDPPKAIAAAVAIIRSGKSNCEASGDMSNVVAARWACHFLSNLCYGGVPNNRQRAIVARWSCHMHVFEFLRHVVKWMPRDGAALTQEVSAASVARECLKNMLFRFPFDPAWSPAPPRLELPVAEWQQLLEGYQEPLFRQALEYGGWIMM